MKTNDAHRMLNYLLDQQGKGMNWVGYSGLLLPGNAAQYVGFISAIAAHRYCAGNTNLDFNVGATGAGDYRSYVAITNFVRALKHQLSGKVSVVADLNIVASEVERLGLHFPDYTQTEKLSVHLAAGDIVMAGLTYAVTPREHVNEYVVAMHSDFRERGRQQGPLDSATTLGELGPDGLAGAWESAMKWLNQHSGSDRHTARITGSFRNTRLELGYKGEPLRNTGVQLICGSREQGPLSVNGSLDVDQQIPVVQYVFLQFDAISKELSMLDDELRPISPGRLEHFASFEYIDTCRNEFLNAARELLVHPVSPPKRVQRSVDRSSGLRTGKSGL